MCDMSIYKEGFYTSYSSYVLCNDTVHHLYTAITFVRKIIIWGSSHATIMIQSIVLDVLKDIIQIINVLMRHQTYQYPIPHSSEEVATPCQHVSRIHKVPDHIVPSHTRSRLTLYCSHSTRLLRMYSHTRLLHRSSYSTRLLLDTTHLCCREFVRVDGYGIAYGLANTYTCKIILDVLSNS